MDNSLIIQGRQVGPAELAQVRGLLASHPDWSRYRLSRELCLAWNWRSLTGQVKDMAARSLLLKLEARGWVALPVRRCLSPNRMARRLARDWQGRYGHRVALLETFVERGRFRGTCYRAANWVCVGQTQGRTRQDRRHVLQAPVKDVLVYPLRADFRKVLCQ